MCTERRRAIIGAFEARSEAREAARRADMVEEGKASATQPVRLCPGHVAATFTFFAQHCSLVQHDRDGDGSGRQCA